MASNNGLLPTTATDATPKVEEKIFKGSAMTKRGAYAAISYMACAGTHFNSFFAPSL